MSTPLFDQLVSTASPLSRHVVAPIATRRRQPAAPVLSETEPLTVDELTTAEREIVAEMGGSVARLILRMLDDDTTSKRRWPFHEVR
ncbi:hypothetical protein EDF46_2606 [Frondihabitans sp. PhB188]|uniref:hypothetical protein n=1 Tax=Frondihabitans sp. PhB188 TaxID=2485200 RepID=UPI000F4A4DC4|nr:hypothetical protein [Frondihabitans sp. PhB188]ROQ37156.1 hypothetical protein EDF46_2606 [Frondihabitans sp. PhB188]